LPLREAVKVLCRMDVWQEEIALSDVGLALEARWPAIT